MSKEEIEKTLQSRLSEVMEASDRITKICIELSLAGIAISWMFLRDASFNESSIFLKCSITTFCLMILIDLIWNIIRLCVFYHYSNPQNAIQEYEVAGEQKRSIKKIPSFWAYSSYVISACRVLCLLLGYLFVLIIVLTFW